MNKGEQNQRVLTSPASVSPGKHCVYSSLRTALHRHGVEITEAELFMLCGSMCAEYRGDLKTFGPEKYPEQLQEMAASGGPVIQVETWNPEYCDEKLLIRALTEGHGTMLHMSSHALTYHEVYTRNYPRGHVIELYGLDLLTRTAYVNDSFLLDSSGQVITYDGPARLDDLMEGIMEYAWLMKEPPILSPADIHTACAHHIRQYLASDAAVWRSIDAVETFYGDSETGSSNYLVRRGERAYEGYIADFRRLPDMDDAEFRLYCSEIYYNLRLGSALHLADYTGEYCRMHAETLGVKALDVAELAEALHAEWHKLNLHIYKTGLQLRKRNMLDVADRAQLLLGKQRRMLEELLPLAEQATD